MARLRTFVAIAVGLLVMAAAPSPASAHTDKVFQGNDFAIVHSDHKSGSVCDEERDGHRVFARWSSSQGGSWTAEAQGSSGPCTNIQFRDGNGELLTAEVFQVCEVSATRTACRTERT